MNSHKRALLFTAVGLTTALALGSFSATAADLPRSGSFTLHSGWKGVGEVVQVGNNHIFGAGNFYAVAFNDAGSGPLHKGAVVCSYALELINGAGPIGGPCAWSDSDGDKFFTSYTGKLEASGAAAGDHKINRRHRQVRGHPR
jgi:hypothetical protein